MADELRRPLRRRRISDHLGRLRPSPLAAATASLVAMALGVAVWLAWAPDDLAQEPVVVVRIDRPDPVTTATTEPSGAPASERAYASDAFDHELVLPSPDDIAADLALASQPEPVLPRQRPLAPAPIKAVTESGPFGPLPRIASDGRKPHEVYARPAGKSGGEGARIALVLGGMGLNGALTRQAIGDLPAAVTLAFAPYGDRLQELADEARGNGHEVMLHLPMEPFGYPAIDPGPKTLRAGDGARDNAENLNWLMSRFAGYIGAVNYMGARLSTDEAALRPVLAELAKRGLVYLDSGASSRSLAVEVGGKLQLPIRRAHRVIDSDAETDRIMEALAALEDEAHRTGLAIGSGTGLPVTLDAVQSWARDVGERGITLVPASAAFREVQRGTAANTQAQ